MKFALLDVDKHILRLSLWKNLAYSSLRLKNTMLVKKHVPMILLQCFMLSFVAFVWCDAGAVNHSFKVAYLISDPGFIWEVVNALTCLSLVCPSSDFLETAHPYLFFMKLPHNQDTKVTKSNVWKNLSFKERGTHTFWFARVFGVFFLERLISLQIFNFFILGDIN